LNGGDFSLLDDNYNKRAINKGLLKYPNCIFQLEQVNSRGLDDVYHHDYLLRTIPIMKRYSKWSKVVKNDDVELIMARFNVSSTVANQYLKNCSKQQIDEWRIESEFG
jgi:hypothetical protein